MGTQMMQSRGVRAPVKSPNSSGALSQSNEPAKLDQYSLLSE